MHTYLSCLECRTTAPLCSSYCMTVRRRGLCCRNLVLTPSFSSGSHRPEVVRHPVHQIWPAITRRRSRFSRRESRYLIVVSVHPTNRVDPRPSIYACVVLLHPVHVLPRTSNLVQAGLSMLANTGRWPAIYGQLDYPSFAMLSSIRVNNHGNVVIGANIASVRRGINHRGPLVWLCHEVGDLFGFLTPEYQLTLVRR
jgi:hypothetical protein